MGACCSKCLNKSFYALELSIDISKNLEDLMKKIKWTDSFLQEPRFKLGKDIKSKIASAIVKHIKEKKITVNDINGFVTQYIALNIACFIFHKVICDIIYLSLNHQSSITNSIEEANNKQYPKFMFIEQNYSDIFTMLKLDQYFNTFTQEQIDNFKNEFKIKYDTGTDLSDHINRKVLEINLENYVTETIEKILSNNNIKAFNHDEYMNYMLDKQSQYETEIKSRT